MESMVNEQLLQLIKQLSDLTAMMTQIQQDN